MPPLTAAEEERLLRVLETQVVGPAAQRAMRGYLEQLSAAARAAVLSSTPLPGSLAAAGAAEPVPWPTVGEASEWWAEQVDAEILNAVWDAWERTYRAQDGLGAITKTSQDALADYVSKVRDRLVRGLEPPVYADSFDKVRQAVADAEAAGWPRTRLADSIATRLDWSPSREALQREWDDLGSKIDGLLDKYGPPGDPVREMVKASSPQVRLLQQARSRARLRMDADESWWRVRAQRIARTEATGAHAYGRLRSLKDTGETHKQWNSAHDSRTRPAHAAADGQVVEIDKPFTVGGVPMQMPCDPTAPAGLVVNCRCFLTHAEAPETLRSVPEPEPEPLPDGVNWASSSGLRSPKTGEYLELDYQSEYPDSSYLAPETKGLLPSVRPTAPGSPQSHAYAVRRTNPFNSTGFTALRVNRGYRTYLHGMTPALKHAYRVNCQRVTLAYEMRRRGWSVTAAAGQGAGGWSRAFVTREGKARFGRKAYSPASLDEITAADPDGARYFVTGAWKSGGAHIWNAEKVNGKIVYHEAQVPKGIDGDQRKVYDSVLDWSTVTVLRVDDLEVHRNAWRMGSLAQAKDDNDE